MKNNFNELSLELLQVMMENMKVFLPQIPLAIMEAPKRCLYENELISKKVLEKMPKIFQGWNEEAASHFVIIPQHLERLSVMLKFFHDKVERDMYQKTLPESFQKLLKESKTRSSAMGNLAMAISAIEVDFDLPDYFIKFQKEIMELYKRSQLIARNAESLDLDDPEIIEKTNEIDEERIQISDLVDQKVYDFCKMIIES